MKCVFKQVIKQSCRPTASWGPALDVNRTGPYSTIQSTLYDKPRASHIAVTESSLKQQQAYTNEAFRDDVITSQL